MWDRWALIGVAALIGAGTCWWGWKLGKGGDWLAGVGAMLLGVISVVFPLILASFGPATGR